MKLGILGTGEIVEIVLKSLEQVEEIEVYAVASRTYEKACTFAEKHHIPVVYRTYEELAKDKDIELIYIATPIFRHFEDIMTCLNNGKNVICEKPLTVSADEAKIVIDFSRKNNLFLSEALWTRFLPCRGEIESVLKSMPVGEIKALSSSLETNLEFLPRMVSFEKKGGALLDTGIYQIHFALEYLSGNILKVSSVSQLYNTGVDAQSVFTFLYDDGKIATFLNGFTGESGQSAQFVCENGYITIEGFNIPQSITVNKKMKNWYIPVLNKNFSYDYQAHAYQFIESVKCITEGKIETYSAPLSDTLKALELADEIKKQWSNNE